MTGVQTCALPISDGLSVVRYYYSQYENGTDSEFTYAYRGLPILRPGEATTVSTYLNVYGLMLGTSYFVAKVDTRLSASETDQSNKAISYPITYTDTTAPAIQNFFFRWPYTANTYKTYSQSEFQFSIFDDVAVKSVDLAYSTDNGANWNAIVSDFPYINGRSGNGYSWVIPGTIPLNSTFKVKLVAHDSSGNSSSQILGPYTIIDGTQPSLSIISPAGGEVYKLGDTKTIAWSTSSPNGITSVTLTHYYGTNQANVLATLNGNPGSYSWSIPLVGVYASSNSRIKIRATDANGNSFEAFSPVFSVIDGSAPPPLPWGTPDNATATISGNSSAPATVVDSSGTVHLIYLNGTSIYYQKKVSTSWSSPSAIYTNTLAMKELRLTADSNNNIFAGWVVTDSTNADDIYFSSYNGTSWTSAVNLSNTEWQSRLMTLATDSSNNLHIVWFDCGVTSGSSCTENDLMHRYRSPQGVWSPKTIIPNTTQAVGPALAKGKNGTMHLVYTDTVTSNPIQYGMQYRKWDGSQWSSATLITGVTSPYFSYARNPNSLTADSNDHIHLNYKSNDSGYAEMYTTYDGTSWLSPVHIGTTYGSDQQSSVIASTGKIGRESCRERV